MKKIIYTSLIFMSAVGLSSCSLFNKNTDGTNKNDNSAQIAASTGKQGKSGKKEVKQANVLPQDRQAIEKQRKSQTYSPEEFKKGIVKGDWAIETVYGAKAVGEKAPFLKFSEAEHKVYGNNGCNTINADYTYNAANGTLSFSNVAVTMMLCAMEGITDAQINSALNETRSYKLESSPEGYQLNLFNKDGLKIMELTHQNFEFLNGTWKIVEIDGESVDIEKMKLVFDIDEHKVHGNTGCNVLNGRLETDMDAPNSISFENMAVTMMMCPEMEYQTALLVALEETCRAKPTDRNQVEFFDPAGKMVLVLERTTDK